MTTPQAGVTTELIHPSPFVFGQTPVYMQWAAAAASAPRELGSAPFTYCDLGCGDGSTLNVLAAEYPAASFVGIDRDAGNLARARKLATRAGLANVSFLQPGFAGLPAAGLPPMDFIAAHGVYSWIDESARQDLHAFVASHLKPGGLFCLHYASLPGSAVHDPLYHYLRLFAGRAQGERPQRLMAGFAQLQKLKAHAGFFRAMPTAGQLLDSFGGQPLGQLAHEVLDRAPHSLFCAEVHAAMATLGLSYVGSGDLKVNHPGLMLSRSDHAVFEEVTRHGGQGLRQTVFDLILNTQARMDVFRKDGAEASSRPDQPGLRGIGNFYLRRIGAADSIDARRRVSAALAVDLASPAHAAVLDAVGEESRTVAQVLQSDHVEAFDRAAVEKAIAELFLTRFLNVLLAPTRELAWRADRRYRLASSINSILLDETIHLPEAVAFASGVLGSALMIPAEVRLRLSAWLGRDLERIWRIFGQLRLRLPDGRGGFATSLEQFRAGIEGTFPQFVANFVPDLLRFGLLEEES